MALVAYGNSDSSDYEDEVEEDAPVVLLNNKTESKHVPEPTVQKPITIKTEEQEELQENGASLFNFLPQPSKKKPSVIEEDDEFLHKKETSAVKPKARITVPSLSDFKDVNNITPNVKPRAPADKKSSLLSMLPQPRNGVKSTTKSLIPHVLTKKPAAPVKKTALPTTVKKPKVEPGLVNEYSDESDNDEVENDFFSIHKPVDKLEDIDVPLDIAQNAKIHVKAEPRGIESFFKKEEDVDQGQLEPNYDGQSMEEQGEASSGYIGFGAKSSNDIELDDEAIMKLVGARGKRKREEIQIVDVNQAEVLADAREMLMKGLMDDTTQRMSASKKKGNEPTTQQRRKHQITYLAYQAKANEAELQNQWANNRMSKRQTQAKYGF